MKKVIAGISGGIDSAVTACLLKSQGFDVAGVHILTDTLNPEIAHRLQLIREHCRIPVDIIDAREQFLNSVIQYFRSEHLAGRSPSPCAICNPRFKWKILMEYMHKSSSDGIASGHYIQKELRDGFWFLKKGEDDKKDQSYFLWGLGQEVISKLIAPLGASQKETTRSLAGKYGLNFLLESKESTGLCFSQGLNYSELIKKHVPEANSISCGVVKDETGNIIGKHKGYFYYTIGQKKELDLNISGNWCVTKIIAKENTLVAAKPESLWKETFDFDSHYFIDANRVLSSRKLQVKIRGFGWNPECYARVLPQIDGSYKVYVEKPVWAPAPGQPVVFYDEGLLLGGGLIK